MAFYVPKSFISKRHEIALSVLFAANRRLFGHAYAGLQPQYFDRMPANSGVFISFAVPTNLLSDKIAKPGDIDMLIVPYEDDDLILGRALAIEVKALRATFVRQGRSPNEIGLSQTNGLQQIGFPHVALAHLIVSDESPESAWREMGQARVLDNDGNVELLEPVMTDCLPMDLIERCFGRLNKVASNSDFGLVAAYIDMPTSSPKSAWSFWHPETRQANRNPMVSEATLRKIADYFDKYPQYFLDNPRHDPPALQT